MSKQEFLYLALLTKANKEVNATEYQRQRVHLDYSIEGAHNTNSLYYPENEGEKYTVKYVALVNNKAKLFYDKIYKVVKLDEEIVVEPGAAVRIPSEYLNIYNTFGDK